MSRAPAIPRFPTVPGLADYLSDLSRYIGIAQANVPSATRQQPYDQNLTDISAPFVFTAAGRALLDDADAAAQLTTLGISTFIKTLLDDANAAAALATLGVTEGTWTPTCTNVANVAAVVPQLSYYYRIGNSVTCWGTMTIDPTAAVATQLRVSIPVASAFIGNELDGVFTSLVSWGHIFTDAANDAALFRYTPDAGLANQTFNFHFSYKVV